MINTDPTQIRSELMSSRWIYIDCSTCSTRRVIHDNCQSSVTIVNEVNGTKITYDNANGPRVICEIERM